MALRCPACRSKDLWQPRRYKNAWDDVLAAFGYERLDCRNCKKRSVFPIEKRRHRQAVAAPKIEPTSKIEPAPSPAPVRTAMPSPNGETTIGKTVVIHGDLSCREFLHVFGEVKGTLNLNGNGLLIEPGAQVIASVQAGEIVVQGQLCGGPVITDRVTICRNGSIIAELKAGSIVVEDGARLQGKLDTVA